MGHWLAAAILMALCTSANAQTREFIIAGIGANKCSTVLKNYSEGPKAMGYLIITWAQGFWSSQNAMFLMAGAPMMKNLAGDDETRIKAMMDLCRRRLSDDFGLVVRDYFNELPNLPNPRAK
jgi:hypothetical protein